jgi:hypothetical protein
LVELRADAGAVRSLLIEIASWHAFVIHLAQWAFAEINLRLDGGRRLKFVASNLSLERSERWGPQFIGGERVSHPPPFVLMGNWK